MRTLAFRASLITYIPLALALAACESSTDDVAAGAGDTPVADGGEDTIGSGGDTAIEEDSTAADGVDGADDIANPDVSDPDTAVCTPGANEACYSGPAGTEGVGSCLSGKRVCDADGAGWGPCEGEVVPAPESCLTAADDDCDGDTNEDGEGCVCVPGAEEACYDGPEGTEGVGVCKSGLRSCNASGTGFGDCVGMVMPSVETCETEFDEDCDGAANEEGSACVCVPGSSGSCYTGPEGTANVGVCKSGSQVCDADGKGYGECTGDILPDDESCVTPEDDDCDGTENEDDAGCVCTPGDSLECYTGPAGTEGVGACQPGAMVCNADGLGYGACSGDVVPKTEDCATSADEDCTGAANEAASGCICLPGATEPCYDGPIGTKDVGDCASGSRTCAADGRSWGACDGQTPPGTETCLAVGDEDCDGLFNEDGAGCVCVPGAVAPCYTGPDATEGVGACVAGTQVCDESGTGYGSCQGEVVPTTETCETPVDDDCDDQVNEDGTGCSCTPGSSSPCYDGPAETAGVGPCKAGTQICKGDGSGYGECTGQVQPATETCNTAADDDCDGQINEEGVGCVCLPNSTDSCYTGAPGTAGVGACKAGSKTCNAQGTAYGACTGDVVPVTETCTTTVDDDCDGQTNESGTGCICVPGTSESCYGGPAGTSGVGACKAGTKVCNAQGTAFGACSGDVQPTAETCNTAADDDCDGQVNEDGAGCVCVPGSAASCYTGAAGTQNVGVCKGGTKTCNSMGTAYGACTGEVTPVAETCNTPADDDCDGQTNESGVGCVCLPLSSTSCYTGAAGTENVGACKGGTKTCNGQGTAYGSCVGETVPATETCNTTIDDDCDGQTNESGAGCVCLPNATTSCYTGPAGTSGKGQCKTGTSTCNAQGTVAGPCSGEILPGTETCENMVDDDCDGQTNESGTGCVCIPGSSQSCYTGPANTSGVGICKAGTRICNSQGTAYGACSGEVIPGTESCSNALDDDCDGQANEGCPTTYAFNVKPIYQSLCGGCHTGGGSGGSNHGSTYADTQKASNVCPGKTVGECTLIRMNAGTMPPGAGGVPSGSASQRATIQAWIDGGMLP